MICADCGRQRRHKARRLCGSCYTKHWNRDRHDDYDRVRSRPIEVARPDPRREGKHIDCARCGQPAPVTPAGINCGCLLDAPAAQHQARITGIQRRSAA